MCGAGSSRPLFQQGYGAACVATGWGCLCVLLVWALCFRWAYCSSNGACHFCHLLLWLPFLVLQAAAAVSCLKSRTGRLLLYDLCLCRISCRGLAALKRFESRRPVGSQYAAAWLWQHLWLQDMLLNAFMCGSVRVPQALLLLHGTLCCVTPLQDMLMEAYMWVSPCIPRSPSASCKPDCVSTGQAAGGFHVGQPELGGW